MLRPANDYVSEFIANVNPLRVLTAWNVMRGKSELESAGRGWIWLDRRKTTRFKLDKDNKVTEVNEMAVATWVSCVDTQKPGKKDHPVFWATPGTSLKTVMLAMHRADTAPVALFNDDNTFPGAIGVRGAAGGVEKVRVASLFQRRAVEWRDGWRWSGRCQRRFRGGQWSRASSPRHR